MKVNPWTITLAAAGVITLGGIAQAEEAAQQHPVLTALSSTTLSGYVDTSAIWKFGTGNANMPGRVFDGAGKQDGFNLDVVKLTLEKPLEEGQWAAGYKVDLLFGPDAAAYNAIVGGAAAVPGQLGIEQAYVDVRAPIGNGVDFKTGVWTTPMGYEVFEASNDPNFSRSYGYFLEPLQHTGILATYQLASWASLSVGVANTLNSAINGRPYRGGGLSAAYPALIPATESEKAYMGSLTLTAPDSFGSLKGATLSAVVMNGLNGIGFASTGPLSDISQYYVGATVPTPIKGLAVGVSYDYRGTKQNNALSSSTYANATSLYLTYQATEKLKLNNRAEYATGTDGTFGVPTPFGGPPPSNNEQFFGETFTVDYSLWANVISRVEFRWDRDLKGGPGVFGTTTAAGYGRDRNALSLALNMIYKF